MPLTRYSNILCHVDVDVDVLRLPVYRYIYYSCIIILIRNGPLEVVEFLVNGNHCQANAANNNGETALHCAFR